MSANANDGDVRGLVDQYMARIEERAARLGPINRFYAYQADDLQALEWAIQEIDPSEQLLHDQMTALYERWLDAMTSDEQQAVFEYNRKQHGSQGWNHVLEEVLDPQYGV